MAHTKVTKTYSQNTGAANTFSYSGSFDVFKGTEVVALLDNVALTYTASTINESASPREYSVDSTAKTIHIGGADLSSGTIIIRPETDLGSPTARASYTPGASITADDLNNNQLQLLRRGMEYEETALFTTGGTMTGDLTIGEDQTIIFEGATDNAYETTLTVTDPTADRTITIPNVTGTVVTTGDTGTVATAMIADDAVDNDKLANSIVSAISANTAKVTNATHTGDVTGATSLTIANSAVTTAKIAADNITSALIADDQIDSEHYAAGSIDLEHMSANSVDSDQYVDGSIDGAHIANDVIDSQHYAAASIDNEHLADDAVGADELAANAVVNASVASGAAIAHSKLAAIPDTQILVGNGSTVPTAVAVSGDVTIANTGAVTIANDAVEIAMIGCEQTTITDSDSHIPTSGAVVDYVAAQIAPIGGLEVIADDESFPNTIPAAGVVISISDAAGLSINSSGVSTNGDALDNSTITINGFPSELRGGVGSNADPYVLGAGTGLMVQSTGSSQTYNYHQVMIRESDFVQLSDDINDFNARYRVNAGEPGSNNDEGDLVYDTNANKMKVYDSSTSAWKEVTSTGDFKYLFLCPAGGTGAPTLDGSIATYDLRESSNSGSSASVSSAAQLIVSLNGVIQKANTGTSAPAEGFALVDANTIIFGANLASGDSVFITQAGSAVSIPTPGDGTVTAAKIAAGAVVAAGIGTGAVEHAKLANDAVDGDNLADNACDSEHYTDGSIDHVHLADDCVDADNIADNSVGLAAMAGGTDGVIITYDASGNPVHVGPGTDGQVLTSTGAGSPPAFEDAAGGGAFSYNATSGNVSGINNSGQDLTHASNQRCTLIGYDCGKEVTDGPGNTAVGAESLFKCTTGDYNTVLGHYSMAELTTGNQNVAIGNSAMSAGVTTGDNNVSIGLNAGNSLTSGAGNVFIGKEAGKGLTDVSYATAVGWQALKANTSGIRNTAMGYNALHLVTSGGMNTAVGYGAGNQVNSGGNNTFFGHEAANATNTGSSNTIVGYNALYVNTTGSENTIVGREAGYDISTGSYNTYIGKGAGHEATTGGSNTAVGINSGGTLTTGSNNVFIGHESGYNQITTESNSLFIARGATGHGATAVWLSADASSNVYRAGNGTAFSTTSDIRIKKNITDNTEGLNLINQIKVKNFEYKTEEEIDKSTFTNLGTATLAIDKTGIQTGVIAQELETIKPDWVKTSENSKKTVDSSELIWNLVTAVQELSAEVKALKEAQSNG